MKKYQEAKRSLQLLLAGFVMALLSFHSVSYAKQKNHKPARQVAQAAPVTVEEKYGEDSARIIKAFETRAKEGKGEHLSMMDDYLQRLLKIYVRTDKLVKQFDADLAKGRNAMGTENYKDIQAYYALHKRLVNRIIGFHRYLIDMMNGSGDEAKAAEAALKHFNDELKDMSDLEKIAYQEIFQRVAMNIAQASAQSKKLKDYKLDETRIARMAESIETRIFRSKEIKETMAGRNFKKAMELETLNAKESKALPEFDGNLDKEFRAVKSTIEIPDDSHGRKPNASGIRPGTDDMGWVTGNGFQQGEWAITYDDGPSASNTNVILKALNDSGVKATFFWLSQLTSNPALQPTIDAVKASGHQLANHSHTHANLPTLGDAGLDKEIIESQKIHTQHFGEAPKFFRCPYGACGNNTSGIRQRIANLDMVMAFWNVDSLDWQDHNPESVKARIKQQMAARGHGIVLMHDIHASTAEASKTLIPELKAQGIKFVTMSEGIR